MPSFTYNNSILRAEVETDYTVQSQHDVGDLSALAATYDMV